MNYVVEREYRQWHIREEGQLQRGTTVTDAWLERMEFGRPTRTNIDAIVAATQASVGGVVLDGPASRRLPYEMEFKNEKVFTVA